MRKAVILVSLGLVLAGVGLLVHRIMTVVPEDEEVSVYFQERGRPGELVPVRRAIPATRAPAEKIRQALEFLLEGPTAEEAREGLFSSLPPGALLRSVRLNRNIVLVDFSPEIEAGGGTAEMAGRLAQVVFTATQYPRQDLVRLLIEGSEIEYFSGEGLTQVERPMGRADFTGEESR